MRLPVFSSNARSSVSRTPMQDGIMIPRGGATLPQKPDVVKYGAGNGSPTNRGLHHNAGTLHVSARARVVARFVVVEATTVTASPKGRVETTHAFV